MQEARLENWRFVDVSVLGTAHRLMGTVYGHSSIADGSDIKASLIVEERLSDGVVQTQNTLYRLGSPMSQIEADKRLIEDFAWIFGHIGLAQDEYRAQSIPPSERCQNCFGTGNGLLSGMYQKCGSCNGSGRTASSKETGRE